MQDSIVAYKKRLENMLNSAKKGEYGYCFNIARGLTSFSWTAELKDEVFISEILEAIFKQMYDTVRIYKMPDSIKEELRSTLSKLLEKVISAYDTRDASTLYEALKEIRYTVTYHQLNTWQKCPKKIQNHGEVY